MEKMPAGNYYIGDLCYVLDKEWDEVCDLLFKDEEYGKFVLADGRQYAMFRTMYGDGRYFSNVNTVHPVDSGTIGCILMSDIKGIDTEIDNLGAVVSFDKEFEVDENAGIISFGNVRICTGDDEDDEDEDEDE